MYEPSYVPIYLLPLFCLTLVKGKWLRFSLVTLAILLTTSRTAIIAIIIASLVIVLLGSARARKNVTRFFTILLIVLFSMSLSSSSRQGIATIYGFFNSAVTLSDASSAQPRLESWLTAIKEFNDSPIFGIGAGNYGDYAVSRNYSTDNVLGKDVKTTNLYLEVLAEQGLIGLLSFVIWIMIIMVPLIIYRKQDRRAIAFIAMWISFIVTANFSRHGCGRMFG